AATHGAIVVLPVPGGPHRTIECGAPEASETRSGAWGAVSWGWPTTSSSVRGRIRSASGAIFWLAEAPRVSCRSTHITVPGAPAGPTRPTELTVCLQGSQWRYYRVAT